MLAEIALYFDRLESRLDLIKDLLNEIGQDAEQLNWRPEVEEPSIFALAAFVAMNTDYWIGYAIGNLPEPPGFDSVLEQAQGNDVQALIRRLDSSRETSRQVLEKLDVKILDNVKLLNDEPITIRLCLLQALEDAAENYGKIELMIQWWNSKQL